MQHWKQHKQTCTNIKIRYDNWKEERSKTLPDGTALDTKEGPCAICLEETITNPVVLPCGHVFCFACVGSYQQTSESDEASCPYCRGEIPDVVERSTERGKLYLGRAMTLPKGSEEQKKYAKLALAEYDSSVDLFNLEDAPMEFHLSNLYVRAMMMSRADIMPEETIKTTKKILSLDEKYPGILDSDKVAHTKQYLADAYSAIGKWEDAGQIYSLACRDYMQRREFPITRVAMGWSRSMYETGKYDLAIKVGSLGIEVNRTSCGVHKYVALSQKAKGDINDAKKTMSRAILYEEHWDKDNLLQNKEILRELNVL